MKRQLCLILAVMASVSVQADAYYRVVQGRIIPKNNPNWTVVGEKIKVVGYTRGALQCVRYTTEDHQGNAPWTDYKPKDVFILTNYPSAHQYSRGDDIRPPIMMMRIGSVPVQGKYALDSQAGASDRRRSVGGGVKGAYEGSAVEMAVYDYGVDYYPPAAVPKAPSKNPTASSQAGVTNQPSISNAGSPTLTAEQARTLKFNQEKAAEGDRYGLYRMGLRYRDGDGVEKNLGKAREMLKAAADAGHSEAAAELEKLPASEPPPETNSAPRGETH